MQNSDKTVPVCENRVHLLNAMHSSSSQLEGFTPSNIWSARKQQQNRKLHSASWRFLLLWNDWQTSSSMKCCCLFQRPTMPTIYPNFSSQLWTNIDFFQPIPSYFCLIYIMEGKASWSSAHTWIGNVWHLIYIKHLAMTRKWKTGSGERRKLLSW